MIVINNQSMVTDWINQKFGVDLNNEELISIKEFALIWNVFENIVCNTSFTVDTVENNIRSKSFSISEFQNDIDYFKNRYVENGATNSRFGHLRFRRNDRETFVREVLLGNITDIHEIILGVTIIIYRFRNNLFHGLKDFKVINGQSENFQHANSFLMTLLNYF